MRNHQIFLRILAEQEDKKSQEIVEQKETLQIEKADSFQESDQPVEKLNLNEAEENDEKLKKKFSPKKKSSKEA